MPDADLDTSAHEWAESIVANSWHTVREEKKQMRLLAGMNRDDGIKWAREHGPGAAPDMLERIRGAFKR